ncbi:MAG: DUF427 domain-containing protein [Candidatus Fermentibacterota bacterium]
MRAVWNGQTIAQSEDTIEVEGNAYFPPDDVMTEYLERNDEKQYTCPKKGEAQYWDLVVGRRRGPAAAWSYPDPEPGFEEMAGYLAFGEDVEVIG